MDRLSIQGRSWLVLFVTMFLFALGGVACRTSSDAGTKADVAGGPGAEGAINSEDDVPESMWSPSQRRAKAGYFSVLGEYASLAGNPARSARYFERAYDLDPNAFLGGKLVEMKAGSGRMAEAAADARKFVLLYPKDARLKTVYAMLLARGGLKEDAIPVFEDALRIDPRQADAWEELVAIHHLDKRSEKAIDAARRFTKAMPDNESAWLTLAKLYVLMERKKESLEPARRAYEMQSRAIEPVVIYAMALELNGKTREAVSLYEQLYRLNPTDEGLVGRMVEIYREMGDLKDGLELIDDMRRRVGDNKPALELQRVFILWELKRFEEAAGSLEALSRANPESDRLMYMHGLGQERIGQASKALEAYDRVPANSPFRSHADMRVVMVLRDLKRLDEAMNRVREMVKATPPAWEPYEMGGHILGDMSRNVEAVAFLREGLTKIPGQPRLLFILGVYQEKAGDIDGCVATMREVIRVEPENAAAYNYLGYLFADRGTNLDEAERLIKKALELRPDDGFFMDSLGWVYFKRRDYDKALATLQAAARRVPDEGVVFEHIGDVYLAQGRVAEAKAQFEKALGATLEDRDRARIQEKMKKLGDKTPASGGVK